VSAGSRPWVLSNGRSWHLRAALILELQCESRGPHL
jgi:hypothetical protein